MSNPITNPSKTPADNNFRPLAEWCGGFYTLVSHTEIDSLVGRLLQIADLTGDAVQRKALKDEIKQRVRNWLDDLYEDSGYHKWQGLKDGVKPQKVE